MASQQPDGTSGRPNSEPESNNSPEHQPQAQTESERFKTSHFYNDGNITFDVRGTTFKVHKSVLALYSEAFKDMFSLPDVQSVESQDKLVPLDDDPKAFDTTLNAIYKGIDFMDQADIMQFMEVIAIAHKYQMTHLEEYLQDRVTKSMLPSCAADGTDRSKFHLYDEHPGLAMAVLRIGSDELVPWALYSAGIQFFSKVIIGDTSTYEPLPAWFALDPELAYAFLILQQILTKTFENWDKRIDDFYRSKCFSSSSTDTKCARPYGILGSNDFLYISPGNRIDPVKEIPIKIQVLTKVLKEQKDRFHSGGLSEESNFGAESISQPETQPQSLPESEIFRTSHFYDDGNITFDVRGTAFKVHKSILASYSEVFKDMFGLPCVQPTEGQDKPVPLDDDPKAFDCALDSIYGGIAFIREANIIRLMDAVSITHKYQMPRLEDYLQDHISESFLPSSTDHGVRGHGFHHYNDHPGLAVTVLRLGAEKLLPWAFYAIGVQFFSKISIGDTSTYGPPPTWFAFDPEFAYSFFVLRQIVNEAFKSWDKKMSDFYATSCPQSSAKLPVTTTKCTRNSRTFGPGHPLYISSNRPLVDPVKEMAPKIRTLKESLIDRGSPHFGWCSKCAITIEELASSVIKDMHPYLIDCVSHLGRMKPRDIPKV